MAANGVVDLHLHSYFSCDGDYSPRDLVSMAREHGFRAIAIADHDTVEAYPEALRTGEEAGVEVIPSIEITTLFDGREFHLQLPFVNWRSQAIRYIVNYVAESRLNEARRRVELLKEQGYDLEWEEVWEKCAGIPPLGVKIARVLLEKPESRQNPLLKKYYDSDSQVFAPYLFYQDYFTEGRPAFVPKNHILLEEVLRLAQETEGVPVLSHPGAYFQQTTREDLILLKSLGLQGLEVYTSYHQPEQTELYHRLAEELDLVATAGSDFHGQIKPRVYFGLIKDGNYDMVKKLRERKG
ncbi:MAG TPA: PHP domain-containing protein [Candidatus Saccharicenans sp.]|nr:PHP domain-containing protein [Candidatus Saccharicenans sp.]HQO75627.1 PHP domain-containing protein [Candidatus Saccharicenans sp.]HUM79391.1 PHP domain-containing protein [Candidatus Saccharicenans sp.]